MNKVENIHKYIWIEFALWFLILCLTATGYRIYQHKQDKKLITYQIFMPDVDGLIVGSPVRFMGVNIGYIDKIKILSDEIYIKMVMSDKNFELPKGAIATVEFNGLGGSKSLEIYPPTEQTAKSNKIIVVQKPVRLSDATSLLADMYNKINSITIKVSNFAKNVGVTDLEKGIDINSIEHNIKDADKIIKKIRVK